MEKNETEKSADAAGEFYTVEKVIDKRVSPDGRIEYFLKWSDWPSEYNTWEPQENLNCAELLKEFEDARRRQRQNQCATRDSAKKYVSVSKNKVYYSMPKICGFDKGYVAERIVGATEKDGHTIFLVKWKDVDLYELVPVKITRYKCPDLVIDYFQQHITWR